MGGGGEEYNTRGKKKVWKMLFTEFYVICTQVCKFVCLSEKFEIHKLCFCNSFAPET